MLPVKWDHTVAISLEDLFVLAFVYAVVFVYVLLVVAAIVVEACDRPGRWF
jgi:hypothetical protein